jgi:NAD(P)H-dependent flavin oxidoreductase YrpB (nitropropane dioxygenase family)
MKMKALVEVFNPTTMLDYATLCGWTLARAHAKSGDSAMIAGYLGKSDAFDRAITQFSELYADQAERDHAAFMQAIRQSRIEVEVEH